MTRMEPLTLTLVVAGALALLGGGGAAGWALGGSQARVAEAQAQAVAEAAGAGPAGTEAALAPVMARVDELGAMLDSPPPYCQPGDLYSESACLAERVCVRAGLSGDGVDATGCDRAMNAWLSEHEISVVEAGATEEARRIRAAVFQRRK